MPLSRLPVNISALGLLYEVGPTLPPLRRAGVPSGNPMDRQAEQLVRCAAQSESVYEVFGRVVVQASEPVRLVKIEQEGHLRIAVLASGETHTLAPRQRRAAYFAVTRADLRPLLFRVPGERHSIRVIPLDPQQPPTELFQRTFSVSAQSSRQGVRLNEAISPLPEYRRSRPTAPGVLQITSGGEVIAIGPDGPTLGGYGIAGMIADADLDAFFMLQTGTQVRFTSVSVDEAHETALQRTAEIAGFCQEIVRVI